MKKAKKYPIFHGLRFMLQQAWHTRKRVPLICAGAALVGVAQNLCNLFIAPVILGKVENQVPLPELLGTIALCTGLIWLLSWLDKYGYHVRKPAEIDVRCGIMQMLNGKACRTSFPNVHDPERQKLRLRAEQTTWGNDEPSEHIWHTLTDVLKAFLGLLIYIALMSRMDSWILLTVLLTTILSFLAASRGREWEYLHKEECNAVSLNLNYLQRISRDNALAKDIRIFGLASWLRELIDKANRALWDFHARRERAILLGNLADVVLTFLRNGIAWFYLIRMTLDQGLSAPEFLLYFTAVSGLTGWMMEVLGKCVALRKECTELTFVAEYLNLPEQFQFEGGKPIPKSAAYTLTLENVTFRYPGSDKKVLDNVNLSIRPGEKIAIVGLNGAGKTTLAMLLAGLYDPEAGRVLLNGQDIREFNRQEYYTLFSAVFQDFMLLDATVGQQISQDCENMDTDKVWACLDRAGLKEFVEGLPDGLNTRMGRNVYLDGILLSGGQQQRMVLARALYKDGPLLLLDEPTAALDPIAENDLYQKYNAMTAGKTAIFISHRLASTRFCDRILFIADGGIAEQGSHAALMALGGEYAKLYEIQSRYYQEGGNDHGE